MTDHTADDLEPDGPEPDGPEPDGPEPDGPEPDGLGPEGLQLDVTGAVWEWRGPSPYYFLRVPADESAQLRAVSTGVTYGWGMIPVRVRIGATVFETSLWPKDGCYVVPLKDVVRDAEGLDEGDPVTARITVAGSR